MQSYVNITIAKLERLVHHFHMRQVPAVREARRTADLENKIAPNNSH